MSENNIATWWLPHNVTRTESR